uniref:MYND-type domain-containing protein n=1 Tax=Anopheles melas TaxID=34690 RepID=A0A182UAD2_9DIPT
MDYLFNNDCKFFTDRGDDGELPEISIVCENSCHTTALQKATHCFEKLDYLAMQRRKKATKEMESRHNKVLLLNGSALVQDKVFQCNSLAHLKMYYNNAGKRLQNAGRMRDSIRYLEAAYVIPLENNRNVLQTSISLLLTVAYRKTEQYRKYLTFLGRSKDPHPQEQNLNILRNKPFPVWQEDAACSAVDWEKELFGTSNSRAVSCEIINGSLVAKRDFNVGDVIFVEKPVVGYVAESRGQCNWCNLKTLYTVPCVVCREVFYCCVQCLGKDEHYHQYECRGYRSLFFPLMDFMLIIRLLVKSLDVLQTNLSLRKPPIHHPRTVEQLWAALLEGHHAHSEDLLSLLQGCTCDHYVEQLDSYPVLIQKASLIMYYLMMDKRLVEDYKSCWMNLSIAERNIFLESVLLRLLCVVHTFMCGFKYELTYDKGDVDEMLMSRSSATDAQDAVHTNAPESKALFDAHQQPAAYARTHNNLLMFWDVCWTEANHRVQQADNVDAVECALQKYCEGYHSTFNFLEHLAQCKSAPKVTTFNQYRGLYRFVREIESSDEVSNVISIILQRSKHSVQIFELINKIENIYNHARIVPGVLMQDEWTSQLVKRGPKLRLMKRQNNKIVANQLYNSFFK